MSQVVAINGDCEAIPCGAPPPPPCLWVSTGITYTDAAKISVSGTKVILGATCTFTNPPNPPDVVILTPGATKLKDNGSNVLRVGDTQTSGNGNTLRVKLGITNKLKSA